MKSCETCVKFTDVKCIHADFCGNFEWYRPITQKIFTNLPKALSVHASLCEVQALLKDVDITENIECEIDGKLCLMDEYRLLIEKGSPKEDIIKKIFREHFI